MSKLILQTAQRIVDKPPSSPRTRLKTRLKALLTYQNGIALAVVVFSLWAFAWVQGSEVNVFTPEGMRQMMDGLGMWGPLLYIGILTIAVVVSQIPEVPLAIAAGAVWGAVPAGIYSVVGCFLGGLIAYFLGRTLGRSTLKALTGKMIIFSNHRGEAYLGWLIFITRLLPLFSFDLISYGAGISGLSLRVYIPATLLGMIPPTFLLTYLGEAFTLDLTAAVVFSLLFVVVLVGLPWGIHRYNWFNLRNTIRVE